MWIDFSNGRWFTIYHLAPPIDPYADWIDEMANKAFRYLMFDDTSDRDYFIEKQLALADQDYACIFAGACGGHGHGDRIVQALAEVYLAIRHEMTPEQQVRVENWYHDAAEYVWNNMSLAEHQGTKGGFCAVVGYMTGDDDMLDRARQYLSYEDTWTIQEDSRHYGGLILERMLRTEIFTHDFDIPDSSKHNLAEQMRWILSSFPHNGFNPPFGDSWIQNEADHYIEGLIAGSYFLKNFDPELAGNCMWLAEKMFEYGKERSFDCYDESVMSMPSYVFQVNPIWFYWFLDESIVPVKPDIGTYGSMVVRRLRDPTGGDSNLDSDFSSFGDMVDKVIHRDSWEKDAIFVMVDPAHYTYKNHENGAGNSITSISYGGEEFLTGKILARFNNEYTQNSVADIPSDSYHNWGASLESFTDEPDYSQSVTSLEGWIRTVTLHKTADRRVVVEDHLPRAGSVYWHLQGTPAWGTDSVVLDIDGTRMEVAYSGYTTSSHEDIDTWSDPDPTHRWGNTGNPDRQLVLGRDSAGSITTTFRPLECASCSGVTFSDFQPEEAEEMSPDCNVSVSDPERGIKPSTARAQYSTDGGSSWTETEAACTGGEGTTSTETITAPDIPFNRESATLNKIRFFMEDGNGQETASAAYTVRVVIRPEFSDFDPGEEDSARPDCSVTVMDRGSGLRPESAQYTYSSNGGSTWHVLAAGEGETLIGAESYAGDNGNVMVDREVEHLWDGETTEENESWLSLDRSGWVEFVFGEVKRIGKARIFGDADGSHVCRRWKLQHYDGDWVDMFDFTGCFGNEWFSHEFDITARRVRLVAEGDADGGVQVYELEVYEKMEEGQQEVANPDGYEWIEARCTGETGSTCLEVITALSVDFGGASDTENRIRFRITDVEENIGLSPSYEVKPGGGPVEDELDGSADGDVKMEAPCITDNDCPGNHVCESGVCAQRGQAMNGGCSCSIIA